MRGMEEWRRRGGGDTTSAVHVPCHILLYTMCLHCNRYEMDTDDAVVSEREISHVSATPGAFP